MSASVLLLIGLVLVIGGIVVLRLHAFIALIAAALVVALLTPESAVFRNELRSSLRRVVAVDRDRDSLELHRQASASFTDGIYAAFRPSAPTQELVELGALALWADDDAICYDPDGAENLELQVGDYLVAAAVVAEARAAASESVGQRLGRGFGNTCQKIGILIAMAAIIGKCLLDSGAAQRIVETTTRAFGERNASLAFVVSGFVLGIPVFFDTVFFLLIPLAKALYSRTGRNYLLYVMSVVVGATMAHSLVPPTPGPLFVAGELGVSVGVTMLAGIAVGAVAALAGYGVAWWTNQRLTVAPHDDVSAEDVTEPTAAQAVDRTLPSIGIAILPIVLPVVLLAARTVSDALSSGASVAGEAPWIGRLQGWIGFAGDKNVALSFAAAIALITLWRSQRGGRDGLTGAVQSALASGGTIILITAAGGAFGQVIRQTDIAGEIVQWIPATGVGVALLLAAFAITSLVRIAQGSATVAMITAVGIIGPVVGAVDLPYHPVYLVLAIGCGSKPLPWMNDSGFWVVGRMSGLTPSETLRSFTVILTVMGLVGLAVTVLGALLIPLV